MRILLTTLVLILTALFALPAQGVTMRYALIIGNNIGVDESGKQPFPPLLHAEKEAKHLRNRLVGLSNFDPSAKRTRLITGGTVKEVEKAFRELAAQKSKDQALLGTMESIFLLYFTGHGLTGRLLLKDAPLYSEKLIALFNSVRADFSVGVFDACYAGSLDGVLSEKGIRATPGFNMIKDLPSEVLSAKGSIWFVSSGSGQPSYEDDQLGGVFTHFFIEALTKAEQEGPGITLERIWQYVRENTTQYTAARRRTQVPEQFVAKLRAKAPVYFSFPVPRSATLVLSEGLEGRFALAYAKGHLTEIFEKRRGEKQTIPIYPGSAKLIALSDRHSPRTEYGFSLAPGGTIVLHAMPETPPKPSVGERATSLFAKGTGVEKRVAGTKFEPAVTALAGVGYGATFASKKMLHPLHRFTVPVRLDWGGAFANLQLAYGMDRREYPAWGYTAHLAGGTVAGGYGWDAGSVRLGGMLAFSFAHLWQEFKTNDKTTGWQYHPKVEGTLLFPKSGNYIVEVNAHCGPLYAPGAGLDTKSAWHVAGGVGLTVYFRLM